jgi:hypothetical protein
VVNFDLTFSYVLPGWEGSAHDGRVLGDAMVKGLPLPIGKYYLGDAVLESTEAQVIKAHKLGPRDDKPLKYFKTTVLTRTSSAGTNLTTTSKVALVFFPLYV